MHKFYLICPINLENALIKELKLKNLYKSVQVTEITKGGIELECELELGLSLNNILKTPTRILLRVKQQKCRDFPKLYNIIKKIQWKHYLVSYEFDIKVSTSKSRIIHSDKAGKTIKDAIGFYFNANKISQKVLDENKDKELQQIFIRINQDEVTISLDTSGEALYIRGNRSDRGHASLRESYASCLLMLSLPKNHQELTLCDPMCGTGTFLTESRDFFKVNNHRDYAYQSWPMAKKLKINYIKMEQRTLFKNYIGHDIDEQLILRNSKQRGIEFKAKDIFKNGPIDAFIISNLPYGKRVKINGDLQEYFSSIISKLKDRKGVLLLPQSAKVKNKSTVLFNNNGIKVRLISL